MYFFLESSGTFMFSLVLVCSKENSLSPGVSWTRVIESAPAILGMVFVICPSLFSVFLLSSTSSPALPEVYWD